MSADPLAPLAARVSAPAAAILSRSKVRASEALPWLAAVAAFFVFPDYMALGAQVLVMVVFALSLDLVLGYAGIITLGHAAFFGTGAYAAGMLSALAGWNEPLSGLLFAGLCAGVVGFASGWFLLRYHGLTLLMLTLATAIMLQELANALEVYTGGFDGLLGVSIDPILGRWDNDLWRHNYYWYTLAVLFVAFVAARRLVHSPFGHSLIGIRENVRRMHAIGTPVHRRLVADLCHLGRHGRRRRRRVRPAPRLRDTGGAELSALGNGADHGDPGAAPDASTAPSSALRSTS